MKTKILPLTIGLITLVLAGCATCGRKCSRNPNVINQTPAITKVTIDPVDYKGTYYLAGKEYHCKQSLPIGPGVNTHLSVYGTGSGTDIYFDTDADGKIKGESIKPSDAASLKNGKLTFKTAKIKIQPDDFVGRYYLAGYFDRGFTNQQSFVLVKSLPCWLVFYERGSGHQTSFSLDAKGKIMASSITNPLAVSFVSPNTLKVNSTNVFITNTTGFGGTFRVGNTVLSGPKASFRMVINYPASFRILDNQTNEITPLTNGMNPSSTNLLDANNILQTFTFDYIQPRG